MDAPDQCRVQQLNFQVGQFLEHGKFAEAAVTASSALRMLLPHVLEASDESIDLEQSRTEIRLYRVPAQPPSMKIDECIFSLFCHSFLCRTDDTVALSDVWDLDDCRRVAAAIVYDMGLAYHLEGLRGAHQQLLFGKALKAYHAAGVLLSSTISDLSIAGEDVKLLILAIANNKGRIYEDLRDTPSIRMCLQELHVTLAQTWWSEDSAHFHETGILFPTLETVSLLLPPAA